MKTLAFISGLAIVLFIGAQVASATQVIDDALHVNSLKVGQQGSGGVTYFNGTIINETTTNGVDNPVAFGDNVRIDGRVYRGATAGTGDSQPFIVNDNMEVVGSLTVGSTNVGTQLSSLASTDASLQSQIDTKLSAESDPQVGAMLTSYVPRWNGSELAPGSIFDNGTGVGIGVTDPSNTFQVNNLIDFDNSGDLHLTGIGYQAGSSVTAAGVDNTFLGFQAGDANTSGPRNIGIGSGALGLNTTGRDNIAIGSSTLDALLGGFQNVAIGNSALGLATGNYNIAIGYQAGDNITTGSNNIIIGNNVDPAWATWDDQLNIGGVIFGDLSEETISFARTYDTSTDGTTLSVAQSGEVHTNGGSSGAAGWDLPNGDTGTEGVFFTFIVEEVGNQMAITPAAGDQIIGLTDTAGDSIASSTLGNTVTLMSSGYDGHWHVLGSYGTWTDIN